MLRVRAQARGASSHVHRPVRKAWRASHIAERLGLAPNTLTFIFDRLRFAGLVTVRRITSVLLGRLNINKVVHQLSLVIAPKRN